MSRDPTPFATRAVLRGLAVALRVAEDKAALETGRTVGRPPADQPLTAAERADVARARAWLTEAARSRGVTNGRRMQNRNGRDEVKSR